MGRKVHIVALLLVATLLGGCALRTVDEMYTPPKRSAEYMDLQNAIDAAMVGLEYAAPLSGENQQTVQMADLDGDGNDEYLLFAKGTSENPLKILIFTRSSDSCTLHETIESRGSAFEFVEYVNVDGKPGMELVVGVRVSDRVIRYLTVHAFFDGDAQQLMAVNYDRFVAADLDGDSRTELMVIADGESDEENAVAALYSYSENGMFRSVEAALSGHADRIKRIMVSTLYGGIPAVYVASSVEENAIITDVFALKDNRFANISLSNESGTSVNTMRNYYVYADDIDNDGALELPSLINMVPVQNVDRQPEQQLIRWYTMRVDGAEVDKMFTFHNFDGGWYLQLDSKWAERVSVTQEGTVFTFYVWDASFEKAEKLLSISTLSGSNREEMADEEGRFPLYKTDGVIYAAKLEVASLVYGIDQQSLMENFRIIHTDWNTGET